MVVTIAAVQQEQFTWQWEDGGHKCSGETGLKGQRFVCYNTLMSRLLEQAFRDQKRTFSFVSSHSRGGSYSIEGLQDAADGGLAWQIKLLTKYRRAVQRRRAPPQSLTVTLQAGAAGFGMIVGSGCEVLELPRDQVGERCPAEAAGVAEGMVITAIDDQPVAR